MKLFKPGGISKHSHIQTSQRFGGVGQGAEKRKDEAQTSVNKGWEQLEVLVEDDRDH